MCPPYFSLSRLLEKFWRLGFELWVCCRERSLYHSHCMYFELSLPSLAAIEALQTMISPWSIVHVRGRCRPDRVAFVHQIQNFSVVNDQMLRQVLDVRAIFRMLSDLQFVLRSSLEIEVRLACFLQDILYTEIWSLNFCLNELICSVF